ncbi:hypothetical protein WJX73_003029 [Symbiochloris irregularis]|uniref:Uncharacterized protein n=1 Tax=Symbiochloris irregularis TaxID=706552 RepID=A0AAW1NQI4_9CHLO
MAIFVSRGAFVVALFKSTPLQRKSDTNALPSALSPTTILRHSHPACAAGHRPTVTTQQLADGCKSRERDLQEVQSGAEAAVTYLGRSQDPA